MSLDVFNAYIQGYSDRLFDQQILGVQQGYWAGYFARSRRPKSSKSIIDKLVQAHERSRSRGKAGEIVKPDVDVEAFKALEKKFQDRRKQLGI